MRLRLYEYNCTNMASPRASRELNGGEIAMESHGSSGVTESQIGI
jgi:hypothetical protein